MDHKQLLKSEQRLFFQRWLKSPKQLGTLAPISQRLANKAASLVHNAAMSKIVEIGAGTGRLTRTLLEAGIKVDNLTAVELDGQFCHFLKNSLPQIQVIEGDASYLPTLLDPSLVEKIDYVFSVIPLMYLPQSLRDHIVHQALSVLKPTGKLYHVCYSPFSPLEKNQLIKSKRVVSLWLNAPPGFVWEFESAKAQA